MRKLVFDQSSPVHPVSESRGGTLRVTKDEGRREILVSNFGFINSGHIIENNGAVWHNCNAWSILIWKIQYLKYHMNEKKILLQ